jgi:hypothetical protein
MVAAGQHILQQRKECHVRFDASVGVHSQSFGHRPRAYGISAISLGGNIGRVRENVPLLIPIPRSFAGVAFSSQLLFMLLAM